MNCSITLVTGVTLESDPYRTATLDELQAQLAAQALHVVTAADKAVLDAVRECYEWAPGALPESVWRAHANVVIARREAAK